MSRHKVDKPLFWRLTCLLLVLRMSHPVHFQELLPLLLRVKLPGEKARETF
jgi:hypothetical protein